MNNSFLCLYVMALMFRRAAGRRPYGCYFFFLLLPFFFG